VGTSPRALAFGNPARNSRNVGTKRRYAYSRIWRPAGEATDPMTTAVEKSMTPLTNQKVRIDGANRQPFRIAVKWPLENVNSWERRSASADRRFRPTSMGRLSPSRSVACIYRDVVPISICGFSEWYSERTAAVGPTPRRRQFSGVSLRPGTPRPW
jgi:hypothetical protein